MDKVTTINDRIEKLRKQKIRVQLQEAVLFKREAEKIFDKAFTPELALAMMSDWTTATETKKKEWVIRSNSFRINFSQQAQTETKPHNKEPQQNGKTQAVENG